MSLKSRAVLNTIFGDSKLQCSLYLKLRQGESLHLKHILFNFKSTVVVQRPNYENGLKETVYVDT